MTVKEQDKANANRRRATCVPGPRSARQECKDFDCGCSPGTTQCEAQQCTIEDAIRRESRHPESVRVADARMGNAKADWRASQSRAQHLIKQAAIAEAESDPSIADVKNQLQCAQAHLSRTTAKQELAIAEVRWLKAILEIEGNVHYPTVGSTAC